MKNFNYQLLLVATIILSIVTIVYSIIFSFQLAKDPLIGTLMAMMMIGFNILEFSMITFLGLFVANKSLIPIFLSIVIVISGLAFSIFANIWVVSDSYASNMQERRVTADSYKAWERKRDSLLRQSEELRQTVIPASIAKDNLSKALIKQEEILNRRAFNSNEANTGQDVGRITENCTKRNYYYNKYCENYQGVLTEIKASQTAMQDSQKLVDIEDSLTGVMASPPESAELHAPGINTITILSGKSPEGIIALLNFWLALFNEIGAIFGWFVVGRGTKKANSDSPGTIIESDYTVDDEQEAQKQLTKQAGKAMAGYTGTNDNSALMRVALSQKLKTLIDRMDTTATGLSKSLGIPQATFNEYVTGKRIPPITALLKLKEHLHGGFNIDKFLDITTKEYK